jgi:hypothetical protein
VKRKIVWKRIFYFKDWYKSVLYRHCKLPVFVRFFTECMFFSEPKCFLFILSKKKNVQFLTNCLPDMGIKKALLCWHLMHIICLFINPGLYRFSLHFECTCTTLHWLYNHKLWYFTNILICHKSERPFFSLHPSNCNNS